MTLFKNFRSTTFIKAFTLNSMLLAITTTISYTVYQNLDYIQDLPMWINGIITLILTFLLSMMAHLLLFYIFSFGGGMLTSVKHSNTYDLFSN